MSDGTGGGEPKQPRAIDEVCRQVERRWRRGERPSIEEGLASCGPEDRQLLLVELLRIEWGHRRHLGERFEVTEYVSRFAGDAAAVEKAWLCSRFGETSAENAPETVLPELVPTRPPEGVAPGDGAALPGGYEAVVPIGEGGMGAVYKAFDPRLRRWVALKMLRVPRPDLLARFRTEAEAVARLSHPHVVQVFALERYQGQPCLVMEFVPGGSLEERLGRLALPWAEAARLVGVLARAVQAAHAAGVVHRDLKPANVLMAPPVEGSSGNVLGGSPKVSDFGLARLAGDQGQTGSGQLLGTPYYLSPEQALGRVKEIGPATDVWALGVILYRCLTGALPFEADSVLETLDKVRGEEPRPPGEVGPAVPAELEALCLRCMEKDPSKRPSAGELAAALERLGGAAGPSARQRSAGTTGKRRRLLGPLVAAVVLLVTGAVAAWFATPWRYGRGHAGRAQEEEKGRDGTGEARDAGKKPAGPPQVLLFQIQHWTDRDDHSEHLGVLGSATKEAGFNDKVRIEARFERPAHAYLIAYNPDGKEQLLWPVNAALNADESLQPAASDRLEYPARKGNAFALDDEPSGGLQAFAVVASSKPLPPFAAWKQQRGRVAWKKLPASRGVWWCHDLGVVPWDPGEPLKRGGERLLKGAPPLGPLRGSLLKAGAEVVEVIAFGVRAKEGE